MKSLLIRSTLILALLGFPFISSGQMGIKISLLQPTGDIGPLFKKAPAYESYYVGHWYDDIGRIRAGMIYSTLQPQLDSFPVVTHGGINDPQFIPGMVTYRNFHMLMIYAGADFKIVHYKKFHWYAGASITYGLASMKYSESYKNNSHTSLDLEDSFGGFIFRTSIDYELSNHFGVLLEASNTSVLVTNGSKSYGHYNMGIGINYFINTSD